MPAHANVKPHINTRASKLTLCSGLREHVAHKEITVRITTPTVFLAATASVCAVYVAAFYGLYVGVTSLFFPITRFMFCLA